MALILFGVIFTAIGLDYRTTGLSTGLIAAGIVSLVSGMGLFALKIIQRNAQ